VRAAERYRNLEFDRLLEQLAGCASSELTRELIRGIEIVFHPARVEENLDQTTEALRFTLEHPSVMLPGFSAVHDVAPMWEAIYAGELIDSAQAREMRSFLEACAGFTAFAKFLKLAEYPRLADIAGPWQPQDHLLDVTKRTFSEDGEVRDNASPALSELRAKLRRFEGDVSHTLRDMLREVKDKSGDEALVSVRFNRFVVLLPRALAGSFKGAVVDVSGTGHSVYFEPAAVSQVNTERQHLFLKEDQEVRRILREYGMQVAAQIEPLKADLAILVKFDYIFARARYAGALRATRPRMTREGGFLLRGAVHPLLFKDFVAEDLLFDRQRALVISGVNAGGKTVLLKLLGLYSLMAALGCFTPGDAQLPYISGLHADIGDDQSALSNLSTFTAHLRFVSELWAELGTRLPNEPPLLVLIDEIGTGTEPGEGAAFAYGLIQTLLDHPVKLAVTTHYDVLKTLAFERGDVKNVCLEFDEEALRPTFHVLDNMPGQSFALAIAERWGVDTQVITRAQSVLGDEERKMAAIIGELEQLRREAQRAKAEVTSQAAKLADAATENEQLSAELRRAKQRFVEQAERVKVELERRIEELLSDTKRRLKKGAKQARREGEEYVKAASESAELAREQKAEATVVLAEVLKGLAIEEADVQTDEEQIKVGDKAEVAESHLRGEVTEIDAGKGEAVLSVMGKRINVKLKKLKRITPAPPSKAASALDQYRKAAAESARGSTLRLEESFAKGLADSADTLDLHGQTTEEAYESLENFISNCLVSNTNTIRIMHGVGSGRLRVFVQDYLRHHKHVANVRHATTHEGGVGVTIAELK